MEMEKNWEICQEVMFTEWLPDTYRGTKEVADNPLGALSDWDLRVYFTKEVDRNKESDMSGVCRDLEKVK